MNKVDTSPIAAGVGYPPSKKGFDFLQNITQEMVPALAVSLISSVFGDSWDQTKPYALNGLYKNGGGTVIFQGYLYYNGEVFFCPGYGFAVVHDSQFNIEDIPDPIADPTQFTDGSIQNVHRRRRMVITDSATPGLFQWSTLVFVNGKDSWHNVSGGVGFQNSWDNYGTPYQNVRYKKEGNFVVLDGGLLDGGGGTGTVAFTLPTGYRPLKQKEYPHPDDGGSGYFTIYTNGDVKVTFSSVPPIHSLDGIRIPLD